MRKPELNKKELLNRTEAVEFFRLNPKKFHAFLGSRGDIPFLAYYRSRPLILRQELNRYFEENPDIKEALQVGRRKLS